MYFTENKSLDASKKEKNVAVICGHGNVAAALYVDTLNSAKQERILSFAKLIVLREN